MTIFGVDFDDLQLDSVLAFLAGAGSEPLRWEAKGGDIRPEHVTKNVGGFANAIEGGYLLLGFEKSAGVWMASGFKFPDDDPPAWVSRIVGSTLRPRPRLDVRDWPAKTGSAAVVRVDSIAEPPCVTNDGRVFERVSGETITVRDPTELRRLYDRGKTAAARAEAVAMRSQDVICLREEHGLPCALLLAVSVGPVGTADDISANLFRRPLGERLLEITARLPREPLFFDLGTGEGRKASLRVTQDAVITATSWPENSRQAWTIRAGWDGSVVVMLRVAPPREQQMLIADAVFKDAVRPMADAAFEVARLIGGYGRAHVVLGANARQISLFQEGGNEYDRQIPGPNSLLPIQRWAEDLALDDALLESMKRELLRACGLTVWEPEVD